jgi:hypothetical protein
MLSFQLAGIPLDTEALKELTRSFDLGYPCYFRPRRRRSVKRQHNLPGPVPIESEPLAFIIERDDVFSDDRDWVRGLVARNPFFTQTLPSLSESLTGFRRTYSTVNF